VNILLDFIFTPFTQHSIPKFESVIAVTEPGQFCAVKIGVELTVLKQRMILSNDSP
jgi:hypothetical protein